MAIPQIKYVNIISAVGGQSQVSQRDLMGRVFTSSSLVPYGTVLEMTGLDAVGSWFGVASDEYAFASKYFGYTSKSGNKPQKISFALHATSAMPARLIGKANSTKLDALTTLTNADITFKIDGVSYALSGLNLASATSMADVCTTINNALAAMSESEIGTISYNSALSRFVLVSATTGADSTMDYATGSLAEPLGMTAGSNGAILSDGCAASTGLKALQDTTELTNNFYSFTFLTSIDGEEESIAAWVLAQNVRYMWSLGVTTSNASTMAEALKDYDGVGLSLNSDCVFLPMAIAAAINYDLPNASVDFMYQQAAGIEVSVDNQIDQEAYDAIRVNYYGATQQAGQQIAFYQDGKLLGSISSMGVYVNEAWLKDAIFTAILNLRLSLDTLPATDTGLGFVKMSIQGVIEKAVYNGVINSGKTLDDTQKIYIGQITGDKNAWQDVQSMGYWLDAKIVKYTEQGTEKYKVSYLLVYGKGDSINYVDGKDILI